MIEYLFAITSYFLFLIYLSIFRRNLNLLHVWISPGRNLKHSGKYRFLPGRNLEVQNFSPGEIRALRKIQKFVRGGTPFSCMSGFLPGRNFEIQKFSWGEFRFPNCPDFSPGRNLKLQDFSRGEIRAFREIQMFLKRDVRFPARQDFSPG